MATVAQMIEWMKTLPQDAEVNCLFEERDIYDSYVVFRPVDIENCCVYDYCSEEYRAKYPSMVGKTFVYIEAKK